jgi:hypothetical protein
MRVARPASYGHRLLAAALAAAIFAGSFVMWVGIPAAFIWVSSQTATSLASALAIMLAACPLTMVCFALVLVRLNSLYIRLMGARREEGRAAWLRSLSGARPVRPPPPVLEVSMTVSAAVAVVALLVWFFVFAHSSLPAAPA